MPYGVLADFLVLLHAAFVLFVALGALLVWRWPRVAWLHLPAAVWGIAIEWRGAICPLTPLEHWLRDRAGQAGYEGDFVQHYVMPALYPAGLNREVQIVLGALALLINVGLYYWIVRRRRQSSGIGCQSNPRGSS